MPNWQNDELKALQETFKEVKDLGFSRGKSKERSLERWRYHSPDDEMEYSDSEMGDEWISIMFKSIEKNNFDDSFLSESL